MKNLYEVFDEFEAAETGEEKIDVLRRNKTWALTNVLQGAFSPDIQFCFDGVPDHKINDDPAGLSITSIHQELQRCYLYEINNPRVSPNLTQERKTQLLIQMLEALESREGDILMNMLLKDLKIPLLTYNVVDEAFPGLLPENPANIGVPVVLGETEPNVIDLR
jgi:hypothetical protein